MTNETLDTWLGTVLAQAREQKNHAVVEFLVENIHRRQPLTAQTLIWLAEAQINLLKYKEVWNTVQEILKLDPTDPAARAFRDTIERVASTYVIDGQSRRVGIIDAADFIVAHPTRGKSIPIATLQQADRERSLRVHELYDVMVVGGEGMIFDATTTSVFRNSFASKEHVNVDVMTLERNLRLNTSECVQILGPAVHLCGQWSGNFFHWMSDLLPRVQLLHNRGFDGRYLIPFANHPFIRESFELMGINSERLIQYDPRVCVRCEELLTFDSLWFNHYIDHNRWLIEGVREVLLKAAQPIPSLPGSAQGIYIQRQGLRSVKNNRELLHILNRFKIIPISAESLPLREQVRVAASSRILVGPHGSGLTLSLFMPRESTLIELIPSGMINPCFNHILKTLNHRHYPILSTPRENDPDRERVEPYLPYLEYLLERDYAL